MCPIRYVQRASLGYLKDHSEQWYFFSQAGVEKSRKWERMGVNWYGDAIESRLNQVADTQSIIIDYNTLT